MYELFRYTRKANHGKVDIQTYSCNFCENDLIKLPINCLVSYNIKLVNEILLVSIILTRFVWYIARQKALICARENAVISSANDIKEHRQIFYGRRLMVKVRWVA